MSNRRKRKVPNGHALFCKKCKAPNPRKGLHAPTQTWWWVCQACGFKWPKEIQSA